MGWAVAGIAGAGFSIAVAAFFSAPSHIYNIDVNDLGIARPQLFFEDAKAEGDVKFEPSKFQDVRVCEYKLIRGDSVWNAFVEYLDEYDMCFITNELGERRLTVRPNLYSNELTEDNGTYYCKCSSEIIDTDQQ
ncbi:MAG TPA: hypothetical protein VKA67_11950 [Verrucomicrobiae bacterium]|nr:hypothetical protein [Verrucomicrobiae bacterium]